MLAAAALVTLAGLAPDPLVDGQPGTLRGHKEAVVGLSFAPDGGELASVSRDRTLRVWSLADGGVVSHALKEVPTAVAYSPDGRTLAVGDQAFQVQLFDTAAWTVRATVVHADQVAELAFSPDGKWLAVGGQSGNAAVFDVATGKPVKEGLRGRSPAFSADGKRLLWGQASAAVLGQDTSGWKQTVDLKLDGAPPFLRASPDLARLLVFSPNATALRILAGKPLKEAGRLEVKPDPGQPTPPVFWAVADPAAKRAVVSYHDGLVRLWDVDKKEIRARWPVSTRTIVAVDRGFSQLAVADSVTIKVWALPTP